MSCCTELCICPPSPELEEKIVRSKRRFLTGGALPAAETVDLLDLRTFTLISTRPKKTREHTLVSPTRDFAPVLGVRKALVLLVDFSDKQANQSQAHYSDMLFSLGSHPGGSMRDYYREVSYSKLDVTGTVNGSGPTSGWFRAPQTRAHYADGNYGFNAYPKNAQKLCEDAVDLANPFVNFADYDNDGDGVVDALVIICAGSGGEATGNTSDLWSHKWSIFPRSVDGVTVQTYFMAPEDGRVGVMAHELGHLLLGWPDLYDTDYSSSGTGKWDLMAGGSWNNFGNTPAHPTAWCKAKVGWVAPTTVFNAQQSVTLKPYAQQGDVYKLPVGSATSKEYFLVSNRQQTGFDSALPGEGCIIEHVDDNQSNNTDENHYLVDIEQADGKRDLNKHANSGDAGDVWPNASLNKFTDSTTPNSKTYSGADSQVAVTDIARSGDDITATLKAGAVGGTTGARTWHYNVAAQRVYTSVETQNAWVLLETHGWRQVKPGQADGVTNMHVAFCEAVANGRKVDVEIDGAAVYALYLI